MSWRAVFDPVAIVKGTIRGGVIVGALLSLALAGVVAEQSWHFARDWVEHPRFTVHRGALGAAVSRGFQENYPVVLQLLAVGLALGAIITIIGRAVKSAASTD